MQLPTDENVAVEVLLCIIAEDFVFPHDAFVHVTDRVEIGIAGIFVAVDFVCHLGGAGAFGEEFLDHDKVWSKREREDGISEFLIGEYQVLQKAGAHTKRPWRLSGNNKYWQCKDPLPSAPDLRRNGVGYVHP
jgi:hypothetical protein